eukprot:TRINITY_DN17875_c0_g1_i1.p1 TRINITY_DN17875_c0_g1~~TRINITY_DN17875_c0_g1_i1.p1  ORF type:complete len:216 (-),score=57.65 TRINITY_DN17875_c0_g1_i1:43-690(-)
MISPSLLSTVVDNLGNTALFLGALTGSLDAKKAGCHFWGGLLCALFCGFGGSTLRELFFGKPAPFIASYTPLAIAAAGAFIGFAIFTKVNEITKKVKIDLLSLIKVWEMLTLGFIVFLGCERGVELGGHYPMVAISGFLTCFGGGAIRDVFLGRKVGLLYPHGPTFPGAISGFSYCIMHYFGITYFQRLLGVTLVGVVAPLLSTLGGSEEKVKKM